MAYFSLHAYDADVWIREFRGLNQADNSLNPDPRYANIAYNAETVHGALQPQPAPVVYDGEFPARVETLASFTRRWYTGDGSNTWYVCCAGGKLYQKQAGSETEWDEITLPSGVEAYQCSKWSWVTYEINDDQTGATIDVLLLSNALDGMIMIIPPERPTTYGDLEEFTYGAMEAYTYQQLHSPKWIISTVNTQGKKFGVIERHMERIWGGAINGEPDMLMYSAPYDPTDWAANAEIPEDGAGDILQPTWDGDMFHALKRFGSQLLAFKKNKIWRIQNASPGEYVFSEQYGNGTPYYSTIAVDKERVFMETIDGLSVYDGMSASPYAREQVEMVWKNVNKSAMDQSCAALFHDRYYVAFPYARSDVNNAMLVYDLTEGTILFYKDFYVESFMPTDEDLFFTSSTLPGKIFRMQHDSWTCGAASGAAVTWVTPWMDFGYKRINKGGFDLYFQPQVSREAVEIKFTIETEKKHKTKRYTIQPLTPEQTLAHKYDRMKRLHFSGSGRRFRIWIETDEGITAPWRLLGGLQLVVETDPD